MSMFEKIDRIKKIIYKYEEAPDGKWKKIKPTSVDKVSIILMYLDLLLRIKRKISIKLDLYYLGYK